jgi:hypothetical protein
MTIRETLIRAWAEHVEEVKHVSHKQSGDPFFEISHEAPWISCTFPGCGWFINTRIES